MATPQQKLPKGPSNSSGFGTPGTQQTAQKNVKAGGFDPNMPRGPQAARQARSSYQQSLGAPAGVPGAPATGYALFAGMPTQQAMGLNRSLGLSNLGPMGGGTPPPQAPGFNQLPPSGARGAVAPPGASFLDPQLPPGGAQGATAPRGTAGVLQEDPAERVDLGLPGRGLDVPEPQWKSASMPWLTDREEVLAEQSGVFHKVVPTTVNALQRDPRTPAEGAPLSEEEAWGLYSEGTMTKDQVMQALGMTDDDFAAWEAANDPWAGFRGNVKDPSEYRSDEYNPYTGENGPAVSDGAGGWVSAGVGEGAARGGRLEADLAAREELGAPYVEEPDRALALATGKVLSEQPGYPDPEVQEVKDNLAKQAEMAYQQNLAQLMRQFAVMGSAGSGAFMMANNNLAVQIYGKLLDEYTQIDLKNLDQIEIDLQQEVGNLLSIAQLADASKEDFLDTLEKIDKVLFTTFTTMLETYDLSDEENAEWMLKLAEYMQANLGAFESGEMTQAEYMQGGTDVLTEALGVGRGQVTAEAQDQAQDDADKKATGSPTPKAPSNTDPPVYDGDHDGQVAYGDEYLGDASIWTWNEETGEWEWYGLVD